MTEFNKSLSAALGIEVSNTSVTILDTNVQGTEVELSSSTDKDAVADYTFSRDTFRKLVTKGTKAIDDATELANTLESPRGFEVVSMLIKTVSEVTKDLYELQKKSVELNQAKGGQTTKPIEGNLKKNDINNINVEKAVFVGTPTDMLRQIKESKDGV